MAHVAAESVFHALKGMTDVPLGVLRTDSVEIDGVLDEPVWKSVPLLTGFSLYSPTDGRPSPDSTEVRVWYSARAIHFGIRAFEPHGAVRATLAERDRLWSEDVVEIQLDPFLENRRAFVFIVNPLGVQADGIKAEGGSGGGPGMGFGGGNDLSADFVWQSHGRLTDFGYEVEVRIPFNSLRYPSGSAQRWGLQFVRRTQHNGYESTWTPTSRGQTSFIAQQGFIHGMSGLERSVDIVLNPELTNTTMGAPAPAGSKPGDTWRYSNTPRVGGNVRVGLGSNFVLNGTVRPDFSQVEADATQIADDQRFALFYPERRQFFVEGSDAFSVQNMLIYTRRIVEPDAALKLTGRLGRSNLAVLSAYDRPPEEAESDKAFVNIVRVTRDFGDQSRTGLLLSDRSSDSRANTVIEADLRHLFGGMYTLNGQFATSFSRDRTSDVRSSGALWEGSVGRTGRQVGFHYTIRGVQSGFETDNGFVTRTDYVQPSTSNRFTFFGKSGSLIEQYQIFVRSEGVWQYSDFFEGRSLLEANASANNSLTLRGGWSVWYRPSVASYTFDPLSYSDLLVPAGPSTVPFVTAPRTTTFLQELSVNTPEFPRYSARLSVTKASGVDFAETARVDRLAFSGNLDWRPDTRIRVNATYASNQFARRSDGTISYSTQIPRVKLEYQITRALFVRLVAQYEATRREALRDWRTGQVLMVRDDDGSLAPATGSRSNLLRADWLFSYRPSPGTVFFLGYGNSMTEPEALALDRLRRVHDGFFMKLSWVTRLGDR